MRARVFLVGLILAAALPAAEAGAQEHSKLELADILELARERNPRLRAARAQVDAARARVPGAGLLPDPILQVGVMNLAFPELSATMPASMAPSIQATQRFPLAGKLSLREEMARQSTEIEAASSEEIWWEVRTEAAAGFYRIYELDRQIAVMEETLGLLGDFETVARSMYGAGMGRQADVLRANVEVARMEAEIERMAAMRRGAAARLNALVERPGGTPVPTPVLDPLPGSVPEPTVLVQWAVESRPRLKELRTVVERAGTQRRLAEKEIWPDLTLGLQYGLGRMQGDPTSMGGAMVGFSIPLYAGRRQYKARDEAAAGERMAQARLEQALAVVDARVAEVLANLDQARTLIRLYREEILPQARAGVESSLSSYRVGAVDFMTLVDAQMALNRFQGEYFGLLAAYGTGLAQLEMTIGRELPGTTDTIVEDR